MTNNSVNNKLFGTTTNDNASSGFVGEYVSSSILIGSAVSLSSGSASNVTSISLSAGDWMVYGLVVFNPSGLATSTIQRCGINTTSATMPTLGSENNVSGLNIAFAAGQGGYFNVGSTRISIASTTTIFLVSTATFLLGTMSAYGFIGARRIR